MRDLVFVVDRQKIYADPECDFSGIVRGTHGYLRAVFKFKEGWSGYKRAVSFFDAHGGETAMPLVGDACEIPACVLGGGVFYVSVAGMKGNSIMKTNRATVRQGR